MNKQLIKGVGSLCICATAIGIFSAIIDSSNKNKKSNYDVVDIDDFQVIRFDEPVKMRDIRDALSIYIYEHNIDLDKEVIRVAVQTTKD